MAYIENPFLISQTVQCINDNFPIVETTEEDKSIIGTKPLRHPKRGELCIIDEILGEFIRFDKYDNHSYNWWKHTHFRSVSKQEIEEHFHNLSINIRKQIIDKILNTCFVKKIKIGKEEFDFIQKECIDFNERTQNEHDVNIEDVLYSLFNSTDKEFFISNDWDEGEPNDPFWDKEKNEHSAIVFLKGICIKLNATL